jgi:8-oxo-dGTP pyrophosphatase MutT (NUDIX family)
VDDELAEIRRVQEIEVFRNGFGTLYNDEVAGPTGAAGRYLRWIWSHDSVVVVPVAGALVGLWPMYRYPPAVRMLEFPRGGVEPGEGLVAAALRELKEETGLIGTQAAVIGRLHPDSGLIGTVNNVVAVRVDPADQQASAIEAMESVSARPVWVNSAELVRLIAGSGVTCGITIAAWALFTAVEASSGEPWSRSETIET